jgi:hypothetical protein
VGAVGCVQRWVRGREGAPDMASESKDEKPAEGKEDKKGGAKVKEQSALDEGDIKLMTTYVRGRRAAAAAPAAFPREPAGPRPARACPLSVCAGAGAVHQGHQVP